VLLDAPAPWQVPQGSAMKLAGAVALRAGLLDREEALLHADLAAAVGRSGRSSAGAGLGAAAFAGLAFFHGRDADLGFGAVRGCSSVISRL
jgi:hypothetical protein